jgi:hypothetical protein
MYAERELKRLGEVKVLLRRRIARRRSETVVQAARATKPLQWADRAYAWWQKVGPMAKLVAAPAGMWLLRSLFGQRKKAGSLMRWVPTLWSFVQGFRRSRAPA